MVKIDVPLPKLSYQLDKGDYAIAGAVSGSMTRFLCQPLDVIKVRFQLQVEPLSKRYPDAKYWGVTQATAKIVREEGLTALWKGHIPAQALSVAYGIVQFLSFEVLTRYSRQILPKWKHASRDPIMYFLSGAAAGCLGTATSFPLDVLRTRLIAQGEPRHYRSLKEAFVMIYTKEGLRGFYKGLSPSLIQIAPHTGAQFAFYEVFTKLWHHYVQPNDENLYSSLHANTVIGSMLCGTLAGSSSKALVYPFDVAKRRLQVQGFEEARRAFGKVFTCSGMVNCLMVTWSREGIFGLYKGLWPSLLKAGSVTALHFTMYEQICQAIKGIHDHS